MLVAEPWYGIVGIESSCDRLARERAKMSVATSRPYCSASWLKEAQLSLTFALEEAIANVPGILVHNHRHAVQTEPVCFRHHALSKPIRDVI